MAFQERHRLKSLAKTFLSDEEYSRFSKTLKVFFKKESCMEAFCQELVKFVNSRERTELLVEVRQLLPKEKRSEFSRICRNLVADRNKDRQAKAAIKRLPLEEHKENDARSAERNAPKRTSKMVNPKTDRSFAIVMERDSLNDKFGFKIRGDLFTVKREIIVGHVDKNSIADKAGLKVGDRLININETGCKRARKADIIKLVKTVQRLHLVVCTRKIKKTNSKINVANPEPAIATNRTSKYVTVYSDDRGWMGCCIRGGTDYACGVYITLVDPGSPAERAGLRKGDIITEVNGVPLDGKTRMQAIDVILTSCPPITFTIKTTIIGIYGYPRSNQISSQERADGLPSHTPLRNCNHRRSTRTMATHDRHQNTDVLQRSSISLPLHSLCLEDIPPPPYTVELPDAHKILQRANSYHSSSTTNIDDNCDMVHPLENAVLNEESRLESLHEVTDDHIYETIATEGHTNIDTVLSTGNGDVAGNVVESHFSDESTGNATVMEMQGAEVTVDNTAHNLIVEDPPLDDHLDDAVALKPESTPSQEMVADGYSADMSCLVESVPTENSNGETKRTSFLDDIKHFNKIKLKRTKRQGTTSKFAAHSHPGDVGVDGVIPVKEGPVARKSSTSDLLMAISVALEKRARVFNSSCRSCNESYELLGGNEWEDM